MSDLNPLPDEAQRQKFARERAGIDQSARRPVLIFFASAVFWLLLGSVLALLASVKMHSPGFLDSWGWLTFGRVRPAHLNTMIYGWANMAGFGVMLWLMARLSRSEIRQDWLLVVAAGLWNFGVAVGTIAILAGQGTSVEWLEFPPYVPPILVAAYAFVATWVVATFRLRREQHVYVSQWYLLGAIFWLPWLYTAANLLILYKPVTGTPQATVNWWFAHNFLGLWLTPIGVASAYYLIPKVYGRPIYSYYLSILGFWALALFYNWAGLHHLIGGPVPAWAVSASVVGSMMMFIPVGAVALNHHMTVFGKIDRLKESFRILYASPTLRFVVFGGFSYTMVSVQGALQALPLTNRITHFTHYTIAHAHFGVYGFFTMTMFGSMYYIVPRLTGWEWASPTLIKLHFWGTSIGFTLYYVALTWAGWWQGVMMEDPEQYSFMQVVQYTLPYLWSRSFAGVLMSVGHVSFAILFIMNVMRYGKRRQGPTLLEYHNPPANNEAPSAQSEQVLTS